MRALEYDVAWNKMDEKNGKVSAHVMGDLSWDNGWKETSFSSEGQETGAIAPAPENACKQISMVDRTRKFF
jgi:hypothetical protein